MSHLFSHIWELLIGRSTGPFKMRLILQPSVAAILAIRAGLQDARAGRPPYFWSLLWTPLDRRALIRDGWKNVRKVALMALVLEAVYQIIVFRWVYVLQAVIVAIVLAIVPYLVLRGLTTRLARRGGTSGATGPRPSPGG